MMDYFNLREHVAEELQDSSARQVGVGVILFIAAFFSPQSGGRSARRR